jgi:hypothetical protein
VAREIVDGRRIDFIEVIEDARLVSAQKPSCLGIADVPGVTGEIDLRVERENLARRFGEVSHLNRENYIVLAK